MPGTITMRTDRECPEPIVMSFPSGFNPEKAADECEWDTYDHGHRRGEYAVIGKTVCDNYFTYNYSIWQYENPSLHNACMLACVEAWRHTSIYSTRNSYVLIPGRDEGGCPKRCIYKFLC